MRSMLSCADRVGTSKAKLQCTFAAVTFMLLWRLAFEQHFCEFDCSLLAPFVDEFTEFTTFEVTVLKVCLMIQLAMGAR